MENLAFKKYAPKYQSGIRNDNLVVMVKDLKGILDMVSLDIYQITNYLIFFKKAYHLLDFQKTWVFHEHQSVIVRSQVLFQKSDYLKYQCFGSTGSENGKIFIRTDLFPTSDHKFSSLRQLKSICSFHVSEIFNFQNAMHKCSKNIFISCTFSCKDSFIFKKYTQKWKYNRTTNCP